MKIIDRCRHELTNCLHNPISLWAKLINALIAFLIILSVATIPSHFIMDLAYAHPALILFDKVVVTLFTIEYMLRIWTAKNPLKYIFSWWGMVDLLAILPFYLGQLGLLARPELFLGLRILRLFKLGRIYAVERSESSTRAKQKHGSFKVMDGETIEYIAQRHWTVYVAALFFPLTLTTVGILSMLFLIPINLIFGVVVGLGFNFFAGALFLKIWLDFNYDLIYITTERIVFQRRELFGEHLNEVNYIAVTNIKPDTTGLIRWLFKFGDIIIDTSAMQGAIVFKHAAEPHRVVDEISKNRHDMIRKGISPQNVDPVILPSGQVH